MSSITRRRRCPAQSFCLGIKVNSLGYGRDLEEGDVFGDFEEVAGEVAGNEGGGSGFQD
jgi:hypothetical protein